MSNPADDDAMARERRMDDVCQAFEDQWLSGGVPNLRRHVELVEPRDRPELLAELLRLELHYRFQAGHAVNPGTYLAWFPQWEAVVRNAFSVRKEPRP